MELQELDSEAKIGAIRDIKNMFSRPGQLERVDLYKQREGRKKASFEAQLKTAMQNQLDDDGTGQKQLENSMIFIKAIDINTKEVGELLKKVPKIYESLELVRNENAKHSQYATVMENLKHIFSVQSSVAKTIQWIEEDKLLNAHQCLLDLENSRDDILFELHKLPKQYALDKMTLKSNFTKVEAVSSQLGQKIRLILVRCLATVRKEPTIIVTAMRIIKREETADVFALQQKQQTGFIPPGRPKNWRKMAMDALNETVGVRIEGSKLQERSDNQMWLVNDLEIARQFILEDLRVVKQCCIPCFPPEFNIFEEYVKMYHTALSKHLEEIIQDGLEGNEYASFLAWVTNEYPGPKLMQHPDLQVDLSNMEPLLKAESLKELENEYLKIMEENYEEWMAKTVETEKEEWLSNSLPDHDGQNKYTHQISAPVIIFQMVDQNLQVTNTIHSEFTFSALILSIRQVTKYGQSYRQCIIEFKDKHFKDRSQMPYFTQHIIAIVNNCQQIMELAQHMKQLYWPKSRTDHYEDFEKLLGTFQNLRDEVGIFLLEEAFLDLEVHFNELFTAKWLGSSNSVDTICVTLEDYFHDYNHLRESNFEYVINEAQRMVTKRYIKAMLSKRLSKPKQDCDAITKKINNETKKIKTFFGRIAPKMIDTDSPVDLITVMGNLISCDIEMLILDLHTLFGNYPSLTEDHLVRLFYIRNDVKSNEVKTKIQDAIKSKKSKVSVDKQDVVFKEIVFSDKLW